MTGSIRVWAAAAIAALTITSVKAADLTPEPAPLPPPPAPIFFVHVGALGVFKEINASSTGGGFFNYLPVPPGTLGAFPFGPSAQGGIANIASRPDYTLGLEAGYYVTPNWAIVLSAGIPPIAHLKATGLTLTPQLGTNQLGSVRYGPAMLLLRYQFTNFGMFQPYVGVGAAYLLNFGNMSDGILTNLAVDQNFGFVLNAGADVMLTQNWGVYADVKKIFLSTDASGDLLNLGIPIRTHVDLDPWAAGVGVTFKY
ncbi:MAG TPA: OmpW family outer membrane protein [Methylocella sp.]|nr:OmpW family outer membrane protein [Methylocella sp.]